MEWVETTGRTIEEAKESALDELGVDEQDAEFEVLEEPKLGLFGRLRSEGRIRARIRPTTPRAKEDRRDRRRRPKSAADSPKLEEAAATSGGPTAAPRPARSGRSRSAAAAEDRTSSSVLDGEAGDVTTPPGTGRPRTNPSRRRSGRGGTRPTAAQDGSRPPASAGSAADAPSGSAGTPAGVPAAEATATTPSRDGERPPRQRNRRRPADNRSSAASSDDGIDAEEGTLMDVALDEQGKVAEQFLVGLLDSFGVVGEINVSVPDDDTIDIQVTGDDLGLLIGPKGATLLSIQDLTRTVVQRKTSAGNGRIFVDVAGYRQKRNEALGRFAQKVAADVLASQVRVALEPMSAPDRKTVHDTITEIDGVETISEGEDAQRHVVVLPSAT
jgi:spoIIIJ-associated protein